MEKEKLVTVVVPTYKQTHLFVKAIESVLNQTYKNLEIVVIDDNTDQKISAYIQTYLNKVSRSYKGVSYYKNSINKGSVYSRNVGIAKAKGDYITFLDDDDVYREDKIKLQLQKMLKSEADYSICNIALTSDNKKFKIRERNFLKYDETLLAKHMKYHIAATSTFMYKTVFLKKIGGFSELDLGDDYYLMEKSIYASDKFVHVNYVGVIAFVDASRGLSSWRNKIAMEEKLLHHKLSQGDFLKRQDISYIKMRHYAVKSNYFFQGRRFIHSLINAVISFFHHPLGFFNLFLGKDF